MSTIITPKEYNGILTKGIQSDLDKTPIEDGKLRFVTDTGRLYLDTKSDDESRRIRISDIVDDMTEEQILSLLAPLPKIYISTDTHRALVRSGLDWYDLAAVLLTEAKVEDDDKVLWFSGKDDEQPTYDTDVTYNTGTKTMKVKNVVTSTMTINNLIVTDTLNDDKITHTVEFKFA